MSQQHGNHYQAKRTVVYRIWQTFQVGKLLRLE